MQRQRFSSEDSGSISGRLPTVVAPQTDTPQGMLPFPHDHVVGEVPPQNHGGYSVHWHGFFVLCSAQGIGAAPACLR